MNSAPSTLLNTIRKVVQQELQRVQGPSLAIVQEQHPDQDYACTIRLHDSDIVLTRVPIATSRIGLASIPALNDMVLVQFIRGDINRPVIVGSVYNDEDQPPPNGDGQWVNQLPLGAGNGDGVQVVANGNDTPSVELKISDAVQLKFQDDDPVVSIVVGARSCSITIDSDGTLTINGNRDISLESGGDLVLKGTNVKIEGSGEVSVQGSVINLN